MFQLYRDKTKEMDRAITELKKNFQRGVQEEKCTEFGDVLYWDKVASGDWNPVYAVDIEFSMMDETAGLWNMENFMDTTYLSQIKQKINIAGITRPFCYIGTEYSSFAWHTENVELFSVNFLHRGAPKIWYGIPGKHVDSTKALFNPLAAKVIPGCKAPMRHHPLLVNPLHLEDAGITWTRVVQEAGMIVVTFPSAFHAGYNTGPNFSQAANFATPFWLEFGLTSDRCTCEEQSNVDIAFPMWPFVKTLGDETYTKWIAEGSDRSALTIKVPDLQNLKRLSMPTKIDWDQHDDELNVAEAAAEIKLAQENRKIRNKKRTARILANRQKKKIELDETSPGKQKLREKQKMKKARLRRNQKARRQLESANGHDAATTSQ